MRGATPDPQRRDRDGGGISIHAPHAGRDYCTDGRAQTVQHFNPRAPCGARRWQDRRGDHGGKISIHAPHAGRDLAILADVVRDLLISIHAPHAGRDHERKRPFQFPADFNPRAPCGARLGRRPFRVTGSSISIHAPHAGRDSKSIQNYFTHFCDKRQFLDNFTQNAAF